MRSLAVLLLCAVVTQTYARGEYENGCPKDWTVRKLMPHQNCNLYYECFMGRLLLRACPPFMLFSVQRNRCVWRTLADCRPSTGPDELPQPEENDSHSSSEESSEYDPSDAARICAHLDSDGILLPHEKCNKYYICANRKPVPQRCPVNLLFNLKKDECDWPEDVHCGDRVIPDPEYDDNSDEVQVGAGHSDPSRAPYICAEENSTGVLIAHFNCNQYFICDHGKPVTRRCPANLFFNPKIDECDWPKNVHCRGRVISDPEHDDYEEDYSRDQAGNSDPSKAPYICAKENSSGVLVAHINCHQYYMCDHGKPVARSCPANLVFNPKINKCDWLANVRCRGIVIPNPKSDNNKEGRSHFGAGNSDPSKASYICAKENSTGVLIAHYNCNMYFICDNGRPVARRCPPNLFFNPNIDECDWPYNVHCRGRVIPDPEYDDNKDGHSYVGGGNSDPRRAPYICAKENSSGVLIAHYNCNKYFICDHGKPVARPCPANLFFNPKIDECDWPKNVACRHY